MVSNQEFDLDDVNSEAAKISELISALYSTFLPKHFKKVEDILVSRENRLNEEIQHWKRKYVLVEEKEGATAIGKALVEEEMAKYRHRLDALTEKVTRLNEDKWLLETKCTELERYNKELTAKKCENFGIHPCTKGQMALERDDCSLRNKHQKTAIDISGSDNEAPTQDQTTFMPNIAGSKQPGDCESGSLFV